MKPPLFVRLAGLIGHTVYFEPSGDHIIYLINGPYCLSRRVCIRIGVCGGGGGRNTILSSKVRAQFIVYYCITAEGVRIFVYMGMYVIVVYVYVVYV